jgi:hypothetical protein
LDDSRAHGVELLHNFQIGESDYPNSIPLQVGASSAITPLGLFGEMRIPIQLNHQQVLRTIKVCNVTAERLLACELRSAGAEKFVPELAFGWTRVAAKSLRACGEVESIADEKAARAVSHA